MAEAVAPARPPSMLAAAALLLVLTLMVAFFVLGERENAGIDMSRVLAVPSAQWRPDAQRAGPPADAVQTHAARADDAHADDWRTVALPHHIDRSLPDRLRSHYRIVIPASADDAPAQLRGVCIARWSLNGRVRLEGEVIAGSGRLEDPVTRAHWRPVFFTLPAGSRALTLDIELASLPSQDPGLGTIWHGPREAVLERCETLDSSRRLLRETLGFALWMVGVFAALQAWRLRDRAAFWFAMAAFLASFKPMYMLIADPPTSDWAWSLLYYIGRPLYGPAALMFFLRYLEIDRPALVRGIWTMHLVPTLLLPLLPWSVWWLWLLSLTVVESMVTLVAAWHVGRHAWRHARSSALLLMLAIGYGISESVVDIVYWTMHWQSITRARSFLAVPALLAGITMLLLERQAARHARQVRLGEELQRELDKQRIELDRAHERLARERERAAAEQSRRRILREMHDGVGSRLVAASALLSRGDLDRARVVDSVEGALMELRTTVDALSPEQHHPETLLGAFRYRVEPVLHACGVVLDWDVGEMPADLEWDDVTRLHVTRMLQEIVANVVRHAHASRFALRAFLDADDGALIVETEDDGRGFDPHTRGFGHGLRGLRERCADIGAGIEIDAAPGRGVRTRLWLPPAGAARRGA